MLEPRLAGEPSLTCHLLAALDSSPIHGAFIVYHLVITSRPRQRLAAPRGDGVRVTTPF